MTRKWFGILSAAILMFSCTTTGLGAQGQREGIVVHGRWVLEVHNPDGTIAERREFENALTQGDEILAKVLTGIWTLGQWSIELSGDPTGMHIARPEINVGSNRSVVLRGLAGGHDFPVTLGAINTVVTVCAGTISSAACKLSQFEPLSFSGKTLTPPLALQPYQYVHVTVTYTFGSPTGS